MSTLHDTTLDWADVRAGRARYVRCPDCGQTEIWSERELTDHGQCRASGEPCPVCEAGE